VYDLLYNNTQESNMATVAIKKVIKIGGSLAVILPSRWAKAKLKPGQELVVIADGELRILPLYEEAKQEQNGAQSASHR